MTSPHHSSERLQNSRLRRAVQEAERRYAAANPESEKRFRRAGAVMPGGNTRTVLYYTPFPVTFQSAEGSTLRDVDGHTYADFLGEYSAGLYGHSHPIIMAAAEHALQRGTVLGGPNEYEAEFAALIQSRFPSCELLRFCNSGTEANLMALVTARAVTGRELILVFEGGYHGGVLKYAKGGSPVNAPFPTLSAQYNNDDITAALIERHADQLAAIIVEPMMGSGGAIPAEPEFLKLLRALATRHGIVLIFDEVMTSRLSPGGLQEKLGIRPDLTTFGKYLGGGFSFGAFGGNRKLMERYDPSRTDSFAHAGTFNNNVMTMAAGLAGLRDVYTPETAIALNQRGDLFRARLNSVLKARQAPAQVTGVGSLMSIHFQREPIRAPCDIRPAPEARTLFHLDMMMRGYYFARRGYMTLSIALNEAQYEGFVTAFEEFWQAYGGLFEE
jgi:glutamate-1-semialdehyde 2,1-aminomutase